jgi:Flp pilus assembly protein TadB
MSGVQPGGAGVIASAALGLAALALMLGRAHAGPRRRVTTLVARAPEPRPSRGPVLGQRTLVRLAAAFSGLAAVIGVGGWAGVALGLVVAVVVDRGVRRLEPRKVRAERAAVLAALPFAADLLAAVLRAGAPTGRAVANVADAVGGPLGDRLRRVARGLALGAPVAEAWSALASVPDAAPLAGAAIRASESGAALAGACERLAAGLRAGQDVAAEAAARRAGVLVVLPLGCCFLPAFVLLGVVPVVLGVLDGVLA